MTCPGERHSYQCAGKDCVATGAVGVAGGLTLVFRHVIDMPFVSEETGELQTGRSRDEFPKADDILECPHAGAPQPRINLHTDRNPPASRCRGA